MKSEWRKREFQELYLIPSRNGLSKPSKVRGNGFKMINMGELFSNDRIFDIPMELVPLSDKEKEASQVAVHDLLFARQSLIAAGAGKCSIVMETSPMTVFESHLIRVRLNPTIADPMFYYYYFKTPSSPIKAIIQHSVQAGIKASDLAKIIVDYPPYEEQRRIANILNTIDEKIELNNRINENLEQQLRTIFERWFVFEAQDEWKEKKIGDFLRLERGLSYKGKFLSDDEGIPMLNLGNILPNSVFRPEKLKFYTGEFKSKVVVRPGDIIVANTDLTQAREVLGSAIRVPELDYPTIICSHHISIVKDCTISKNFVLGLLNLPAYRERVIGFATGTTVLALPNEALLNCTFKCPPDSLIEKYDRFANSYYSKIELLRKENKVLTEIRDLLLPRLMNGTIGLEEVAQ